ncbi:MAG: DUF2062 domain-containing protein [Desulfuromonadaceae bacterium]
MPRKFLKKWTPDPAHLKAHKHLRFLGDALHASHLWQFNRGNVAKACAIGFFCMWIPVPFQTVLAAAGAVLFRVNLPVSVALVFITNPLTMPPMFYFCYKVGALLLGTPAQKFNFELSMDWLANGMLLIWKPFVLGVSLVAVVSSVVAYYGTLLLWRLHIVQRLRNSRAVKSKRQQ